MLADLPLSIQEKIVVDPGSACWVWCASRDVYGYGQLSRGGKVLRAHRAIYGLLVGEIDAGLVSDHLCRNHACVNPSHLEPVTNHENLMRGEGLAAQNARKTHCPRGHEFAGDNVHTTPRGYRTCRTCDRERWRRNHALGGKP